MPRISPVPTQIESIPDIRVDLNGTWQYDARPKASFWTDFDVDGSDWQNYEVPGILEPPGASACGCWPSRLLPHL